MLVAMDIGVFSKPIKAIYMLYQKIFRQLKFSMLLSLTYISVTVVLFGVCVTQLKSSRYRSFTIGLPEPSQWHARDVNYDIPSIPLLEALSWKSIKEMLKFESKKSCYSNLLLDFPYNTYLICGKTLPIPCAVEKYCHRS